MLTFGLAEIKPYKSNIQSTLQQNDILAMFHVQEGIVHDLSFKPKGGQIFIFKPKDMLEQNDWRADGHR